MIKELCVGILGVISISGCVPTVGSHMSGKPELADTPYPDINTVPFGEEAHVSRHWHKGPEEKARSYDKALLEKERLEMIMQGEKLRKAAGLSIHS